jgi:hypothetical protein
MTKKIGRPPVWTPERKREAQDAICDRLSDGESLRTICADADMPSKVTVLQWLRDDDSFATQYAYARDAQADVYVDEIKDIADTEEDANRARVRIDARKWVASKLKPKRYGDRLDLNAKVEHSDVSDEALVEKLAAILGKGSPNT